MNKTYYVDESLKLENFHAINQDLENSLIKKSVVIRQDNYPFY